MLANRLVVARQESMETTDPLAEKEPRLALQELMDLFESICNWCATSAAAPDGSGMLRRPPPISS